MRADAAGDVVGGSLFALHEEEVVVGVEVEGDDGDENQQGKGEQQDAINLDHALAGEEGEEPRSAFAGSGVFLLGALFRALSCGFRMLRYSGSPRFRGGSGGDVVDNLHC